MKKIIILNAFYETAEINETLYGSKFRLSLYGDGSGDIVEYYDDITIDDPKKHIVFDNLTDGIVKIKELKTGLEIENARNSLDNK